MGDQKEKLSSKDFVIGTVLGAVAGAGLALLFAPKSGEDLRNDVSQGAMKVMDRANEWKDSVTDGELKERAYTLSMDLKDKAIDKTSQLTKKVAEKTEEITNKATEKVQEFRDKV
ncbi:YtxH domain-containing protein [Virgibacillus soli]|uniref:YtxH domain-containing protein n=1 Tax=Paracerasibacillus soli TaxID=480284 RepID=A0ABU5CTH3_9BACI|nr:YtxH domain-containing protein [Virgibacillus soli]MDY0408715.1 YtxH domain-containing protein [Virgibacillus soli]